MAAEHVVAAVARVAAEIVRRGAPGVGNGNSVISDEIKGGMHDEYAIAQAIAQYREDTALPLREAIQALKPILLFHETGGWEGSITEETLAKARAALAALHPDTTGGE